MCNLYRTIICSCVWNGKYFSLLETIERINLHNEDLYNFYSSRIAIWVDIICETSIIYKEMKRKQENIRDKVK